MVTPAVPTTTEGTVSRRASSFHGQEGGEKSEGWQRLVDGLAEAYGVNTGHVKAWLSGDDVEAAVSFRVMVRGSVGLQTDSDFGKLSLSPGDGGVGLSRKQVKLLGIGLGYKVIEEDGSMLRRDVPNGPSFERYAFGLAAQGRDAERFRSDYFTILNKLRIFQRNQLKKES